MKYFWFKLPDYLNLELKCGANNYCKRLFSTGSSNSAQKIKRKPRSPSEKKCNVANSMREFLSSKPCLSLVSGFIPERYLRTKKSPAHYSFVVDDDVAAQFVSLIKDELHGDIPVIEANPGLGLITRHLLKAGLPNITVFDPAFHPLPPLRQLMNDNPECISVIPGNLFEVYKCIHQDKMDDGHRFNTMFKDFKFKQWKEEPSIKIVGSLCVPYYIHNIIKSIAFHDAYTKLGRVEHFIAITDDIFKQIGGDIKSSLIRTHTLFNLFFDIQVKGEFPRISFLPWDKGKKRGSAIETRVMYLVKITPKADVYETFEGEDLKLLWYFLQDICRSKRTKVVLYFEKWAPWSGLKLIKEGLSPETQVQDLSVCEMLTLFNIFKSLPEFNEDNYIHILESGILTDVPESAEASKGKVIRKIGVS